MSEDDDNLSDTPSGLPSGNTEHLAGSLENRVECNVPIVARPEDGDLWHASMEIPREVSTLSLAMQQTVVDTIDATVGELRRLNRTTGHAGGVARQPWLLINCGLWMRPSANGGLRISVNFSWPPSWPDLSREARDAVFASIESMLEEARQILAAQGDRPV